MKNWQGLVCGSLGIEEGKSTYAMYVGGGIYFVLSKARKNDASLSWSVVGRVLCFFTRLKAAAGGLDAGCRLPCERDLTRLKTCRQGKEKTGEKKSNGVRVSC
jgi:hypothetical protein